MTKTWFTSDTHFGHFNIIEYCNRPFKTVDEMNSKLIRFWNERVKPDDIVYFLGDFCFKNTSGCEEGGDYVCSNNKYVPIIRPACEKIINGNSIECIN